MDHSPLWSLVTIAGPLVLLAALIYGAVMWRRRRSPREEAKRDRSTRALYEEVETGTADGDIVSPPIAPRDKARQTEDEIARERLGGSRGARELGEAPMVPQQGKNTPRDVEPGHTA